MHDAVRWHCTWTLAKREGDWTWDQIAQGEAPEPYEVITREGNLLVTNGRNLLWKALRGDAITAFSAANARLGVGDSATAEAITQTDLQAATNKLRKAMDSGWPKVGTADGLATDNLLQFQSTFGTSEANYAWAEWASFNAASGSTSMLQRKVEALGSKTSGSWTLTTTLTLT
jgi:hypothetical protein